MSHPIPSRFVSSVSSFVLSTLFFTTPAHAALVAINGQQFDDRGTTMLDLNTQLEWFDLSVTKDRHFNDVYFDLMHAGGTFNPADGWRYAYGHEIQDLFSRVFSPGYTAGYLEIPDQQEAVASFINLFGDTWEDQFGTTIKITKDYDAPLVVGRTNGIFATETSSGTKVGGFADVNGNQFAIHGLIDGEINRYDLPDYIQIEFVQSNEFADYESYSNNQLGSWLVRSTVAVPEPSLLALLLLSGLGLLLRRTVFK